MPADEANTKLATKLLQAKTKIKPSFNILYFIILQPVNMQLRLVQP